MSAAIVEAAFSYAAIGWHVFPLAGKLPAIARGRGYLDATNDHGAIASFWRRFPHANIGVSCIATGFFAIDVDPRHGGDETFDRLPELPPTVAQVTGGGGGHLLFRAPNPFHPPGRLGEGIDVKFRGYVVVAPSVHPDTGRLYRWADGLDPISTPIAATPAWLVERLTFSTTALPPDACRRRMDCPEASGLGPKPQYTEAALRGAYEAVSRAAWGQQEQILAGQSFALGTLIGAGLLQRSVAWEVLTAAGSLMPSQPGKRPWGMAEVEKKIQQGLLAGQRHPRVLL